MVRLLNKFRIYFHIILKKNAWNFFIMMIESALTVCYAALMLTSAYGDYLYKMRYLKLTDPSEYILFSVNSSVTNNSFWTDGSSDSEFNEMISQMQALSVTEEIGKSYIDKTRIGSTDCTVAKYPECLADLIQPTEKGKWLIPSENYCVIGGEITKEYQTGDIISYQGKEYRVCDYLTNPFYYLDTSISGDLNYYNILSDSESLMIILSDEPMPVTSGTMVIKINEKGDISELYDLCEKYGTLYTFDKLKEISVSTMKKALRDFPATMIILFSICILIIISCLLINSYSCKRDNSVLMMIGETKTGLLIWNTFITSLLLLISWNIGICLANYLSVFITGHTFIITESAVFSFVLCVLFIIINYAINAIILHRNYIDIYRDAE